MRCVTRACLPCHLLVQQALGKLWMPEARRFRAPVSPEAPRSMARGPEPPHCGSPGGRGVSFDLGPLGRGGARRDLDRTAGLGAALLRLAVLAGTLADQLDERDG